MFTASLFIISAIVTGLAEPDGSATENRVSRVLVLGGNGFIGSSLVIKLLSTSKPVTILNRGSWYFDSRSRIEPYVDRLLCDRSNIYKCAELVNSTQYYDAVVDFSSYYGEDIQVLKSDLKLKLLIIFISLCNLYSTQWQRELARSFKNFGENDKNKQKFSLPSWHKLVSLRDLTI